jgi:hypothetical protein
MVKRKHEDKIIKIKTNEDWFPTRNGCVTASMLMLIDGNWRVCFWGEDDFGIEKDFGNYPDAIDSFRKFAVDFITQDKLFSSGFRRA